MQIIFPKCHKSTAPDCSPSIRKQCSVTLLVQLKQRSISSSNQPDDRQPLLKRFKVLWGPSQPGEPLGKHPRSPRAPAFCIRPDSAFLQHPSPQTPGRGHWDASLRPGACRHRAHMEAAVPGGGQAPGSVLRHTRCVRLRT